MDLDQQETADLVARALAEDLGTGDVTTQLLVPATQRATAQILLEEPGVVCGLSVAAAVFHAFDPELEISTIVDDATSVPAAPALLAEITGQAAAILTGERTALNLLGRLCGVATLTRRFVDEVAGTGATILDTRKTTPGLRMLEKYAVRCGGATNHRMRLDDAILVKDNHLQIAGGIHAALRQLTGRTGSLPVEVEADTLAQVAEALDAGVTRILLDNMTPQQVCEAVDLAAGQARLEASGGVTLENVRAYAEAGVDYISVGALTHAARSLHLSLDLQ